MHLTNSSSDGTRRAARPGDPSLRDLLRTLAGGRWLLATGPLVGLAAAAAYLFLATPAYRSSALVDLSNVTNGVERLDPVRPVPAEPESRDGDIERMRSRQVIGPVVERLRLDLVAAPRHVPLLGAALARRHHAAGPAQPPPALQRFAWGGERIAVERLEVPPALEGVPLTLVAGEDGAYRLLGRDGGLLLAGRVGAPAEGGGVALAVSALSARPGTEFVVARERRDDVVDALLASMTFAEKGRRSGLVEIGLEGPDPSRVAAVVGAVADEYVRQDTFQRAGEIDQAIVLVQAQLGALRAKLEDAEASLSRFRIQVGTVDLGLEAKALVDRVAELQKALSDVEAQREAMRDHYTDRYPEMLSLASKAAAIRGALQALGSRLREVPGTELRATRLAREVTVAADQYTATLAQVRGLKILRAGELARVRVRDAPVVARKPVSPRPVPVLLVALALGLCAGVAAALVRGALAGEGDDSIEIEDATGLPTFASVPHSDVETRLARGAGGGGRGGPLAAVAPDDAATESLRTLRTALGFLLKARGKVVAVSSPAAGAGKTFVVSNLGHLLASAGKRVLLVDADLRRGALHRAFGLDARPGLAEVLAGSAPVDVAVRRTATAGLDLLACGAPPGQPAELLAGARLDEVLASVAERYDVVLLDTAPTLVVTDAVLVGRCAAVNLLVVRSRHQPVADVALALERFARAGVQVHGAIVNDSRPAGRYGRGYGHRGGAGAGERAVGAVP